MSMLSAQIDELRKMAEYYDGSEVASIVRYAADTIWQLRDDLQRANVENAVLRTQLADVTESMGRVEERCAKLRELARELHSEYRYPRVRFHRTSEWGLDDGIESIKKAWQREHIAKVIIEKTLENTCSENAKLRERVAELEELEDGKRYIPQEWYQLVTTENAKLRELCERCAIELYVNGNVTDAATENLFDDMRELGIEVDE